MNSHTVLQQYFGFETFRPGQQSIVDTICAGQDTLALLPTGGGKSVCFQVPGLVLGGTTIVVSPLISLMKDQVDRLLKMGIRATYLNSTLSLPKMVERLAKYAAGHYQFVYMAPERLVSNQFTQLSRGVPIKLLAIDEAHCISQWGDDFRPEYRRIHQFVESLPRRPVIAAFTATATPSVQQDIVTSLKLQQPHIFTNSFRRTNLFLSVIECNSTAVKDFYLLHLLKQLTPQPGIIYTLTRQAASEVAQLITSFLPDCRVGVYHGGLRVQERAQTQEHFLSNRTPIIAATNAFGMGVDKPDVRWVIHYQSPMNLENYYQEAGRAGRDGLPSWCWLLFYPHDLLIAQEFAARSQQVQIHLNKLKAVAEYATQHHCRNKHILSYFGERKQMNCDQCDHCRGSIYQPTIEEQNFFSQLSQLNLDLTTTTLHWLTLLKPTTPTQLVAIPGIGQGWVEKNGPRYFEVLSAHSFHNPS